MGIGFGHKPLRGVVTPTALFFRLLLKNTEARPHFTSGVLQFLARLRASRLCHSLLPPPLSALLSPSPSLPPPSLRSPLPPLFSSFVSRPVHLRAPAPPCRPPAVPA